ncbi:hypothetical protein RHMOL_Rhmol11G0095600 [Rhododendron molle]|uniref:Uncharacterized protein n=1 Tax=Rhododendron molle TaxID=49168 RepID=A0ACC0LRZ6_RHOML|nr:hypothetical protein RHMOL_Rhmol11G0095600 [Rhododendron molle]
MFYWPKGKNSTPILKSVLMQNSMAMGYSTLALLCSFVAAISAASAAQSLCQVPAGDCGYGECTGRSCPNLYPGYKSQWPELKGVSAVRAKQIIEKENPFVKAWIYPEYSIFKEIICTKRVILLTPENNCPNGRVTNSPFVG